MSFNPITHVMYLANRVNHGATTIDTRTNTDCRTTLYIYDLLLPGPPVILTNSADVSDIRLFQIGENGVDEIAGQSLAVEKSLQHLIEKHLNTLLGVRQLASEYRTGKTHRGRIDMLGIDEKDCPVIIEYKRALNENVINQGLCYLDWLLDHRAEFELLVQQRLC